MTLLKNVGREQKMIALQIMRDNRLSLRRSLYHAGCSRMTWYYDRRQRRVRVDPQVVRMVQEDWKC